MKKCQLNVKDSRITLSSALTPHFGYELEAGVGCTFTLDFGKILSVFYSLGMKDELPEKLSLSSKLQLQRGINKYSDKLAFYCNVCSISVPRNQSFLHGLLDKCIFEVNTKKATFPRDGIFHPKVWFLLYTPTANNESAQPYIKVIVSSQNLSKSSNLDYAVAMEAAVNDKPSNESRNRTKPFIDWLNYLDRFTPEGKKDVLEKLKDSISRSDGLNLDYNGVYSNSWHIPLGISEEYKSEKLDLLKSKEKDWLIVVSPFLGEDFINQITNNGAVSEQSSLLTRQSSLTPNICSCFTNTYGLRSILSNNELIGESDQSELDDSESESVDGDIPHYRDIHAKMYIYRSGGQNMFLTGSANATRQAFNDNVEFMLQLELPNTVRSVTYESLCEELFQLNEDGKLASNSPFEEIELSEDANANQDPDDNFYKILKRRYLCEKILGAEVEQEGDKYTIIVRTSEPFESSTTIAPLNARDSAVELTAPETRITGLSAEQLSNFYIITTPDDRFIKIIETENLPLAERDKAVVNSIIESKTDFYKMIELILADVPASAIAQWDINHADNEYISSHERKDSYIPKGIYERFLEAAVSNLGSIDELKRLIESVSEDKADSKLVKMVETFQSALNNAEKQQ
ncbi:MAG: phospholipase D family protein [Thermoguttaceae bacterium]|nr:phospholipase D family protein [Thermoguttaceae bacterium]